MSLDSPPPPKPCCSCLWRRAADRPLIVVVNDNRAVEDFVPILRGFCELTSGDAIPKAPLFFPARDVLPFQNLSPHPELQEERATALWKIATGKASIVVAPVAATAILLRSAGYYSDLARVLRRRESFDVDEVLAHLNTVGYASADVVEMPGQYAFVAAFSTCTRPRPIDRSASNSSAMRSIPSGASIPPRSVPQSHRRSAPVTADRNKVTDQLLGAIHTRLSGKRIAGTTKRLLKRRCDPAE